MVNPTMVKNRTLLPECLGKKVEVPNLATTGDFGPRYDWDQQVQGQMIMAYFIGSTISSIPGGLLAERFGGVSVVNYGTLIPALLNMSIPFLAPLHYSVVLVIRFLMGLIGGIVYPGLQTMVAKWVPPVEKGTFSWALQGGPLGGFVTFTLCGYVIDTFSWMAAYYVTSACILVYWVAFMCVAYDNPDEHPTVTDEEREYIKSQIGTTVVAQKLKRRTPFLAMYTSPPFLAQLYSHFANMWGIYFTSTSGPKYILEVLGFNVRSGGWISGAPYISRFVCGGFFAFLGDKIRKSGLLQLIWIRRIFMISSHVLPGVCLLIMTMAGCDRILAVSIYIAALGFNGAACQTNLVNHQDLAPNFAGSLYGAMNTFGSIPGFSIPPIIAAMISEENTIKTWRPMYVASASIFFSGTILWWIFGSVEVQPWNDIRTDA